MKTSKSKSTVLGASILLLTCGTPLALSADDTGWNLALGISALDADFDDVDDLSFSDSDTAIQIKGGYMFSDVFGIEGGYVDLGDYDGDSGIRIDADG